MKTAERLRPATPDAVARVTLRHEAGHNLVRDHAARMAADARRLLDALRRAGLDCRPDCTCRGADLPMTDRRQTAD